ncbi:MAG TPA: zinc-binding dehydrogenase [Acidimicrobiia bacterium]|jgi:threonine dehydrogenase-like Zn-dependent dehydrogenase
MRAVRADGQGGVRVVDVDAVVPDHATDPVRVRVRSCGICASDLHLAAWNLPVTLGHEFAGVLDDGTAVAVQPNAWCGECDRCLAGETQLCRHGASRLHGVSVDGGLADEVVVDRRCVVPLAPGVDPAIGALVEPLAVGTHAAGRVAVDPGDRVLVIGGGSIGLATVAALGARGIGVDLAARHPHQRAGGDLLGAGAGLVDEYGAVVDAAGTQTSLDDAIARVRPGGVVVVVATYWDPVTIGAGLLTKEVRIVPSAMYGHPGHPGHPGHDHGGASEFEGAAALLAARPEVVDALVHHRFGLDDAPEAFRVAGDRAAGAIKVLLEP